MMKEIGRLEKKYNIKITCSLENEPLGTAGPIRLAKDLILNENPSGLLFVFNSDVICHYPLEKMVEFHKSHGKQGTIMVTEVEDPTKYGVVVADENNRIETRPTSIEREIFPNMSDEGEIYQMVLPGYW